MPEMQCQLKLSPVLIPKPLWGINAHRLVERESWQRMRHETFLRDNNRCIICNKQRPLECHEVFEFDDVNGIAILTRLESRCEDCHSCNHLGRLKQNNPEAFGRALAYLRFINRIGREEVILLVKEAFAVHKTRTRDWEMKVDQELLRQYPELRKLEGHYSDGRNSVNA